jgi:hypothetical protein
LRIYHLEYRLGKMRKQPEAEYVPQPRKRSRAEAPSEAEGRHRSIPHQRRKAGNRDKGQPQMLRDAARHIRLIDQHRVDTRRLHREWTIAQYHPRMVAHPLDRESKGLEPSQPAEFVIELLERPERIILNAYLPELDAGRANSRLGVCDTEDDHPVSTLLQSPGKRGEGIQVTRTRKAESSESCRSRNRHDRTSRP